MNAQCLFMRFSLVLVELILLLYGCDFGRRGKNAVRVIFWIPETKVVVTRVMWECLCPPTLPSTEVVLEILRDG